MNRRKADTMNLRPDDPSAHRPRRRARTPRLVLLVGALALGLLQLHGQPPAGPGAAALTSSNTLHTAVAATPASGQVTAHDGKFWLGTQQLTFHGTNARYSCCTASQFALIASWGMNVIRLKVTWSSYEPNPPVNVNGVWQHAYDSSYLGGVAADVTRAQQAGLYVVVNNASCDSCGDFGFPDWQYQAQYNSKGITYPVTPAGAAQAATDFWSDSLRQQFQTDALKALAGRLKAVAGVAGYEMLNEPNQGILPNTAATTQTLVDWQLQAAQAVRAVDPPRMILFTTRAGYGPGFVEADLSGFQTLGNVAFDVHDYFGARWGDGLDDNPNQADYHQGYQPIYSLTLGSAPGTPEDPYTGTTFEHVRWVKKYTDDLTPQGIPVIIGEFGARGDDDPGVYLYFGSSTAAFAYANTSWISSVWNGNEGFANADGTLKPWGYLVVDAA